ncbi:hypothetical protein AGMMS50218_01200 [Actinomycetota bacterium]|nr:hypothetical protein AGMMS50218_01200 [Actinomycetota bacterium]
MAGLRREAAARLREEVGALKINMTVGLGSLFAAELAPRSLAPISGGFPGSGLPIGGPGARLRADRGTAATHSSVPPDPVAT